MSDITSKICTLPREELEKVIEDLWCQASVIQCLTYLLLGDLEEGLRESRGTVDKDGTTVTLRFQKRGIDTTLWLTSEAWSKTVDLLEVLDGLNSETEITSEKIGGAK